MPKAEGTVVAEALRNKFPGLTLAEATLALSAERTLYEFVKQAWRVLHPHTAFVDGKHIKLICDHLQAVTEGKIRNLLINIPPRHTKSLLVNVFWPCWEWIRAPHLQYLMFSWDQGLTTRDNLKARNLLMSSWYQARWRTRFAMSKDQNQKTRFENQEGGVRIAAAVKGKGMGEGGHRILTDDPLSATQAESKTYRDAVIEWLSGTVSGRDNDPRTTARVLIMQRLHEDDPSGYILKNEQRWSPETPEGWVHVMLPMEFEPENRCVTPWGRDWRTLAGEPLWPARYGNDGAAQRSYIEGLKRRMTEYKAAGQLQQRPSPAKGGIFQRVWFSRRFDSLPSERDAGPAFWFTSWDLAFKGNDSSDYCAGGAFCHYPRISTYYLVDVFRDRIGFPEQIQAVLDMAAKFPMARAHVIEDKANGPALLALLGVRQMNPHQQALQGATLVGVLGKRLPGVLPWNPGGMSKPERYRLVSPRVAAGDLLLPTWAHWADAFVTELCGVPTGSHDDQADFMAQAILWNENRTRMPGERQILIGYPSDPLSQEDTLQSLGLPANGIYGF